MINYSYFRHRFDAHLNPKLNNFVDEVGPVGYAYYYTLLEIYGQKISQSKCKDSAKIHIRIISNTWRKRIDTCYKVLTKMQLSDLLVITKLQLSDNLVTTKANPTVCISIPNFLNYYGSYKKTTPLKTSKKSKVKKSKVNKSKTTKSNKKNITTYDFETPYQSYPRKEGKKRGFEILQKSIKNNTQYQDFSDAVSNYAQHVKSEGTERKYIKQFSTFVNCWEDWVDYVDEKKIRELRLIEILGGTEDEILANQK